MQHPMGGGRGGERGGLPVGKFLQAESVHFLIVYEKI